jgi:hypothetical protein
MENVLNTINSLIEKFEKIYPNRWVKIEFKGDSKGAISCLNRYELDFGGKYPSLNFISENIDAILEILSSQDNKIWSFVKGEKGWGLTLETFRNPTEDKIKYI